jgi:LemA protein
LHRFTLVRISPFPDFHAILRHSPPFSAILRQLRRWVSGGIVFAMKKVGVIILGLIGLLIVAAIIFAVAAVGMSNRFVRLSEATDKQWAQVQNVYQRRADLIPNLVNTVSGAANFEKSTLTEIVQARASVGRVKIDPNNAPTSPETLRQFQAAQDQLSSALSRLLVVVERYPELKANKNFLDLQAQLEGTENRISVERARFNEVVQEYNTAIKQFPGSIIAGIRNFQPKAYFQATAGSDKPPAVNFNFGKATNS